MEDGSEGKASGSRCERCDDEDEDEHADASRNGHDGSGMMAAAETDTTAAVEA